ncbi:ScyD/ScyE family protein [Actinoplanes sp. NPDC023801]|uniref:ScyD/ScyE family protein n=1 Tax=Actinoplanes sp. NPDC023801 TaxID=3154595 RepID=UPI0033FF929D
MTFRSYFAALVTGGGLLVGDPALPPPLPVPGRPAVEVVARGLDNPRGLAFGSRGELYVAEAGRGGPCHAGAAGGTVCAGRSGAITIVEFGRQWRVTPGLPSLASPAGTGASGPSDVVAGAGGEPILTVGADGSAPARLYRGGDVLAEVGGDPAAILDTGRGWLVVDAQSRALRRVNPRGRLQTVAVLPDRAPLAPGSVTGGPDGAWFVGERSRTGAVRPGAARIWRVESGRPPVVWATGFTEVVGLAWSSDGGLYVLERDALFRIGRDHVRRPVAGGLKDAGGLALRGGYAYVSTCSRCTDTGTVLRIRQ